MLRTMPSYLLPLVVIVANVLGAAMALPQAAKLHQRQRVDGVSPSWAAISATVNGWWAVYGIGVGDLGIVPVSVVSVMAYLAIAISLVRFGRGSAWRTSGAMVATAVAIGVVPAIAVATAGWTTAGVVLGLLYGIQLSPAVVTVYRAADVSGVSAATWLLAFFEAILWGVYGLARVDAGLLSLALAGVAMSGLVLARLFVRRPRRTRTTGRLPAGLAPA